MRRPRSCRALSAALLALAACGRADVPATADATPAAGAASRPTPAPAAATPGADTAAIAAAAPAAGAPRGTATVRITGGPKAVSGEYPAVSCADPMAKLGDTQTGVVYAVVAGAHRVVVSDASEAPRPGPQRVATPMGRPGTTVFNVNSATDERQGLLLDDKKPHQVTLGPALKTAEAEGTFLDVQGAAAMVPYAVSVRFTCR